MKKSDISIIVTQGEWEDTAFDMQNELSECTFDIWAGTSLAAIVSKYLYEKDPSAEYLTVFWGDFLDDEEGEGDFLTNYRKFLGEFSSHYSDRVEVTVTPEEGKNGEKEKAHITKVEFLRRD